MHVFQTSLYALTHMHAQCNRLLVFRFQFSVESEFIDEPEIDEYVTEGSSTTVIVVVVVLLILLIIGIVVGIFYSRKNNKCCFAPSTQNGKGSVVVNVTTEDQATEPLNYGEGVDEGDKTTRPIIKAEWARPT